MTTWQWEQQKQAPQECARRMLERANGPKQLRCSEEEGECTECGQKFNSGGGDLVAKLCLSLATPCTVACQAPLSMGFPRQEY